ncbi:MAG: site-specific integrase [Lachnospiraceae bacterium]|nr:site-specific integrase [Lachnospiraceae bacterium]
MEELLQSYLAYLQMSQKKSTNTLDSYQRDLRAFFGYLKEQHVEDLEKCTETMLTSYILFMERKEMSTASISRHVSSIRQFFVYLLEEGKIRHNPSRNVKAPKVIVKKSEEVSQKTIDIMLAQVNLDTPKGLRDMAMFSLLLTTDIRLSEMLSLQIKDVNLEMGYVTCHDTTKTRTLPLAHETGEYLRMYLREGRILLVRKEEQTLLFTNYGGEALTRQGLWKIIHDYAVLGGVDGEINPNALRKRS